MAEDYTINIATQFSITFATFIVIPLAAIFYYITLPFIYLLSILPFPILYLLSDGMYVILYHIIGYRKAVVLQNLRNSFPEKSDSEIKRLCKDFYHYLCDMFLESFKTLTISKEKMMQHCRLNNQGKAFVDKMAEEKKSLILVIGHLGNWEWSNAFNLFCKQQLYAIYHPLHNKYFDGLMYKMRSHFGSKLIAMKDTFRQMLANRNEITITAFIADQTPHPDNAYWTTFLNQDTPVFRGAELISRKLNYPVAYGSIIRIKRGYYEMTIEMLCPDPSATTDGQITEMHTRRLEQDIISHPQIWLWSHKRWKHKRKF